MTRRRMVARERLAGMGQVLTRSHDLLADAHYDLQFSQEMLRAESLSGTGEVEGLISGRGTLAIAPDDQSALTNTVEAILQLEDRREIDILFRELVSPISHRPLAFITSGELRSPAEGAG